MAFLESVEGTLTGAKRPDYLAFTGIPDARLVYEAILMAEVQAPSKDHGTVAALREFVAARAEEAGLHTSPIFNSTFSAQPLQLNLCSLTRADLWSFVNETTILIQQK